jgi:hypothetical protein
MKGSFIAGRLIGYNESPWSSNGRSGVNRRLGIVARSYTDTFGQTQEETTTVDIPEQMVPYVQSIVDKNIGKEIIIPCIFQAKKGGLQGAFLSIYMPKDSVITISTAVQKVA